MSTVCGESTPWRATRIRYSDGPDRIPTAGHSFIQVAFEDSLSIFTTQGETNVWRVRRPALDNPSDFRPTLIAPVFSQISEIFERFGHCVKISPKNEVLYLDFFSKISFLDNIWKIRIAKQNFFRASYSLCTPWRSQAYESFCWVP